MWLNMTQETSLSAQQLVRTLKIRSAMVLVSRTDQEQETMALVSYNMYRHSVIHGKGYMSECDTQNVKKIACQLRYSDQEQETMALVSYNFVGACCIPACVASLHLPSREC